MNAFKVLQYLIGHTLQFIFKQSMVKFDLQPYLFVLPKKVNKAPFNERSLSASACIVAVRKQASIKKGSGVFVRPAKFITNAILLHDQLD